MGKGIEIINGKVRVIFLEVTASMGGVEVSTLQTLSLFDRERFDASLCCPEEGDLTVLCRARGIDVHILPLPRFASVSIQLRDRAIANPIAILWDSILWLYATLKLARFFRRQKADLVCTKGLLAHLYGGAAARLSNLLCVWHVQEVVEARRAFGLFPKVLRWMATISATQVIGDAHTVTAQFSGIARLSPRLNTIYNGVDTDIFKPRQVSRETREQLNLPQHTFVIGCVARLTHGKGQNILLQAFHSIVNRYPDIFLVLVGKGLFAGDAYEELLRHMVTRWGLDSRVRFAGFVPETAPVFNAFNIAVHVSIEPDSPLSVMEAMASGCPLILTAVPGCQELVRDDEVFLIPPRDPGALAHAIVQLREDIILRKRLALAARDAAVMRFNLESNIKSIERVFDRAVSP